jgi:hypothetical protein
LLNKLFHSLAFSLFHFFIMRVIFNLLIVLASLLSLLILAVVVTAIIYGEFNILLPGPGLFITFWGIIIPLLVIDASIIVMAFLIRQFGLQKPD